MPSISRTYQDYIREGFLPQAPTQEVGEKDKKILEQSRCDCGGQFRYKPLTLRKNGKVTYLAFLLCAVCGEEEAH